MASPEASIQESPFLNLPYVVVNKIGTFISFSDKKNLRCVSLTWKKILEENFVFRAKINGDSIHALLGTILNLESVDLDQTHQITVDATDDKVDVPENVVEVKTAFIGHKNSFKSVKILLQKCSGRLESLTISKYAFANTSIANVERIPIPEMFGRIDWTRLSVLNIDVSLEKSIGLFNPKAEAFIALLKSAKFPNLTTFGFKLFHYVFPGKQDAGNARNPLADLFNNLCLNFFGFVANQHDTLLCLNANIDASHTSDCNSPEIPLDILADFSKIKIETCSMETVRATTYLENLVFPCLMYGSGLKNLRLASTFTKAQGWCPKLIDSKKLEQIARQHKSTLENIRIDMPRMHVGWLKYCKATKFLRFNLSVYAEPRPKTYFVLPNLDTLETHQHFLRIFEKNKAKIKHLTILSNSWSDWSSVLWNGFTALETLALEYVCLQTHFHTSVFSNVIEFKTQFYQDEFYHSLTFRQFVDWMITVMPNLQIANFKNMPLTLESLQTMLLMSQLKKIHFVSSGHCGEGVETFCQNTIGFKLIKIQSEKTKSIPGYIFSREL